GGASADRARGAAGDGADAGSRAGPHRPGESRMRRRKKSLEVSTFPFLAVLLCAMGSLILVLLVMDRKAKLAAKYRAQQEYARAADEAARTAAERRAAREGARAAAIRQQDEQARAEWERKRAALHARLAAEESDLQARVAAARGEVARVVEKAQTERA